MNKTWFEIFFMYSHIGGAAFLTMIIFGVSVGAYINISEWFEIRKKQKGNNK